MQKEKTTRAGIFWECQKRSFLRSAQKPSPCYEKSGSGLNKSGTGQEFRGGGPACRLPQKLSLKKPLTSGPGRAPPQAPPPPPSSHFPLQNPPPSFPAHNAVLHKGITHYYTSLCVSNPQLSGLPWWNNSSPCSSPTGVSCLHPAESKDGSSPWRESFNLETKASAASSD